MNPHILAFFLLFISTHSAVIILPSSLLNITTSGLAFLIKQLFKEHPQLSPSQFLSYEVNSFTYTFNFRTSGPPLKFTYQLETTSPVDPILLKNGRVPTNTHTPIQVHIGTPIQPLTQLQLLKASQIPIHQGSTAQLTTSANQAINLTYSQYPWSQGYRLINFQEWDSGEVKVRLGRTQGSEGSWWIQNGQVQLIQWFDVQGYSGEDLKQLKKKLSVNLPILSQYQVIGAWSLQKQNQQFLTMQTSNGRFKLRIIIYNIKSNSINALVC